MLSTRQREKLSHLFRVYDIDRNGFVEVDDFERVIHTLASARGWKPDGAPYARLRRAYMSQWQAIGVAASPPGSGRVKPDGWFAFWSVVLSSPDDSGIRRITDPLFDVMDADGDGSISLEESRMWFAAHGNEQEADHVFPVCDLNGDGRISREEWAILVREFFFSNEPDARGNLIFGRGLAPA